MSVRGLFDGKLLNSMKKGAYLVNTACGAITDRDALAKVTESGHLAGFATDLPLSEYLRHQILVHQGSCGLFSQALPTIMKKGTYLVSTNAQRQS